MTRIFDRNKYGEIKWYLESGKHLTTQAEKDGWRCRLEQDIKVGKAQGKWRDDIQKARKEAKVGFFSPEARAWRVEYVKHHPYPFRDYWKHRNAEREAWAATKEGEVSGGNDG